VASRRTWEGIGADVSPSWLRKDQNTASFLLSFNFSKYILIICSHLAIAHLLMEASTDEGVTPLAFFYCARNPSEPERADLDEIMRSILKQLCHSDPCIPTREQVVTVYKRVKKKALDDDIDDPPKLTMMECQPLILAILDESPASIVLDALDEVDPHRRHELLSALHMVVQRSSRVVKLLISSRDDNDIVLRLAHSPNVFIQASDNGQDIARFISQKVEESIREKLSAVMAPIFPFNPILPPLGSFGPLIILFILHFIRRSN